MILDLYGVYLEGVPELESNNSAREIALFLLSWLVRKRKQALSLRTFAQNYGVQILKKPKRNA